MKLLFSQYQYDGDNSLFEDEDSRQFYESLPDLKAFIPGVCFINPFTSNTDYTRYKFVLLNDKISIIGYEMFV